MEQSSVERRDGKRSSQTREANWSELSPEIILNIGKLFESRLDVCKFRSVCKNWRSSLPIPPNPNLLNHSLPLKIPNSDSLPVSTSEAKNISLIASSVFLVQPLNDSPDDCNSNCNSWFLTVGEANPGKLSPDYALHMFINRLRLRKDPNFPKFLHLSQFRVSEIARSYSFTALCLFREMSCFTLYDSKVVVCSNSVRYLSDLRDCTAIVLCFSGSAIGLRLADGNWAYVRQSLITGFRDILWFKGMVYAVDDRGRLYVIDHITLQLRKTIVDHPICRDPRSIRLVDSGDDVYLVIAEGRKLYKLDRMQNKWDEIKTFGDMILFMGANSWFMVSTERFLHRKGGFVVFDKGIFNEFPKLYYSYLRFEGTTKDLGIDMYCLETEGVTDSQRDSFDQEVRKLLCPPPSWFWPNTFSTSSQVSQPPPVNQDRAPASALPVKRSRYLTSKKKFKGVDIQSSLVPTLRKTWAKYGNLLEGSTVHSKEMLVCVLELLAKAIITLQSNTGRTLTKLQCDDLSSIMKDLKQLNLRIEWLDPFVEKAVMMHQTKLLVDAAEEVDKNLTKTKEMKMKFTQELLNLEEVEKELQKDKTLLSEKIPVGHNLDLCIGDALL